MLSAIGHHYVLRLQIPVNHLFGMHIRYSIQKFVKDCQRIFSWQRVVFREYFPQRPALYPFHFYSVAQVAECSERIIGAYTRVGQGITYLKLLAEETFIQWVTPELWGQYLV